MKISDIEEFALSAGYPIIRKEGALLLTKLINEKNAKNILEIGTAIGYSAALMLSNCNGFLTTLEINEKSASIAAQNLKDLGFSERVKIIVCDAKDILPSMKEKYDFIFLDGPKGQYINYLPYLIELLEEGGILVADNVLFRGLVRGGGECERKWRTIVNNLRKYLQAVQENDKLKTEIFEFADGIAVSRKVK